MTTITQQALREVLTYSPDTGTFCRTLLRDRWGNESPTLRTVGTPRSDGYLEVSLAGRTYKNHRLVFLYMTGVWPEGEVDHINGDRTDNRWDNLRVIDKASNMRNRGLNHNNKSGASGVTWFQQTSQWRARININGVRFSLGLFDTIGEASAARRGAESLLGYHRNHGTRPSWRE